MAKRQEKGKTVSATAEVKAEELKAVRLELPPELHRQLRIEAATQGTHMSLLARQVVEEFLAKRPRGAK
jgi:hypothetical protein